MYEPGNASAVHNHPASEEVEIILCGSVILVDGDEEVPFKAGEWMLDQRRFPSAQKYWG